MSNTTLLPYSHDGADCDILLCTEQENVPRPTVMVCHAWGGRGDHEEDVAKRLAAMGYAAGAIDLYGIGKRGTTTEECQALMTPLVENRKKLQERLLTALTTLAAHPAIDESRIVIAGYCFGGLCALDVARVGGAVIGAVSFHGLFNAPEGHVPQPIDAKVLALHGYDDPMATPDAMQAFCDEMTQSQADWQLHAYGKVLHAFTNKNANDRDFGTLYDAAADERSWTAFSNFLTEVTSR